MLRFIDGFDHYSSSDLSAGLKWNYYSSLAITTTAANVRTGTGALSGTGGLYKTYDNQNTWIMGVALKPNLPNGAFLFVVADSAIVNTNWQNHVFVNANGTISILKGSGTTLGTSTNTLISNAWSYIEYKVVIGSGTSGSATLRVNGVNWLTLTGISTQNTANAFANILSLGTLTGAGTNGVMGFADDYYCCDGTGTINNDFLGDIRVDYLPANGVGTTTQFSIGGTTPAATNWQSVSQLNQDADVTYTISGTVGNEDTYALADLPVTSTSIKGIQTVSVARKDDAGTRLIAPVLRSGGTDYVGSDVSLGNSYQALLKPYELNPNGNVAWTASAVNGLEAGIKVTG